MLATTICKNPVYVSICQEALLSKPFDLPWQVTIVNDRCVSPLYEVIDRIMTWEYDWDGYGASAIPIEVGRNCRNFIKTIQKMDIDYMVHEDGIEPTTYGTVLFEFVTDSGKVIVEIGSSQMAFFTDYKQGKNDSSENIFSTFNTIPDSLQESLDKIR